MIIRKNQKLLDRSVKELLCVYYGLQFPQGVYPSATIASRDKVVSFRLSVGKLLHVRRWNFLDLIFNM